MIEPWIHELARRRQQELVARAERYRRGRSVADGTTPLRPASTGLRSLLGWVVRATPMRRNRQHRKRALFRRRLSTQPGVGAPRERV
jgi:hypothetical protein